MEFDVFICHATEDKDEFVRPLAKKLRESHLQVWYDEFSLKVGDSLRRSIDHGLSKSRFGIVIISPHFINKQWSQWELDGLVQRQLTESSRVILPIWHAISRDEVIRFSPSLADKVAIKSEESLDHVVDKLLKVIRPDGSTLIIARDILLSYGYAPPVVTDDWWLDVVEFSASTNLEPWGFHLSLNSYEPRKRGEFLANAAMQMMWQKKAFDNYISQISEPNEVLDFISSTPGLSETCHENLSYLAVYAPQLTIAGFGGEFEDDFDAWYKAIIEKGEKSNSKLLSLRDPEFFGRSSDLVADDFVQCDTMGPMVRVFDQIDYIAWFLSMKSQWMPQKIHDYILDGLKWLHWEWRSDFNSISGFQGNSSSKYLFEALWKAKSYRTFKLNDKCIKDIRSRLEYSISLLRLPEDKDTLTTRFIESGFIEAWFEHRNKIKSR